ncbi:MAG: hypothetical protein QOJ32_2611 [Frankiaceae bacterium]|nr:hypothetical protein [Frankiaceae bacterium]
MDEAWKRIVAWCHEHSTGSVGSLRPSAGPPAVNAAEAAIGLTFPEQLRRWFALHDGVRNNPMLELLPGWVPLPLDAVVGHWRMYQEIFAALRADGTLDQPPELVDAAENEPAGSPAFQFLAPFVPIATNHAACDLFVDLRPGPLSGCVTEYSREDAAWRGPRWPSLAAMLDDVADSLEQRRPAGHWYPTIEGEQLRWIVVDAVERELLRSSGTPHGDGSQPEDPQRAETEIRAAITQALTGGRPAATVLAAVQGGELLADTLAQAAVLRPDIINTAQVHIERVSFADASHALVRFEISWYANPSAGLPPGPPEFVGIPPVPSPGDLFSIQLALARPCRDRGRPLETIPGQLLRTARLHRRHLPPGRQMNGST